MDDTRTQILHQNFEDLRIKGFQGIRPDQTISQLGITKGAFYYYFPNKKALGYAIVDEMIRPAYLAYWTEISNLNSGLPDAIIGVIHKIRGDRTEADIKKGCPLNNLVQEMSPLDDGFSERLSGIVQDIINQIETGLTIAQQNGEIKPGVKTEAVAHFIWAGIEGAFSIGKALCSMQAFHDALDEMISYVEGLKS